MLLNGDERGVGSRTSLEGRLILGCDGDDGWDTPMNIQSPIACSTRDGNDT